jgi:hypothetical protein
VLFAVFGGSLLFRWPRLAWLHLPVVLWAVLVEWAGWVCPLTPLENRLRELGGGTPYYTDFIEHYLLPVLYPARLTRNLQIILGLLVLLINLGIYGWLWRRAGQRNGQGE